MPPKKSDSKKAAPADQLSGDAISTNATGTAAGPSTTQASIATPVTHDTTAATPMEVDEAAPSDIVATIPTNGENNPSIAQDVIGDNPSNNPSRASNTNPSVVASVHASSSAINGDSFASGSSNVGGVHGDLPRTIVSTDAVYGDTSGHFAVPAGIHGNQSSSAMPSSAIHGNAAVSGGSASTNEASTIFYHIPTPQGNYNMNNFSTGNNDVLTNSLDTGFANPISSEERLKLMNEIERLRLMVFKATISSIGCSQGSVIPHNLGVLRNQLESAERTYELIFGRTESTLVPNETPYFQWRGHFF